MRYLVPALVLLAAQIGAAWATGDVNMARPGGTFATVAADDAGACERLCAEDTLCMAWSFHAAACELKAVVPATVALEGVTSGVSRRAPASLRARAAPAPAPVIAAEAEIESEAPMPLAAEPLAEDEASMALLGGPETEDGLR